MFWSASYSTWVVYTKTIIRLSVTFHLHFGELLLIILRNGAEYRLIISRRGRCPSWLKSEDIPQDCASTAQDIFFIIQQFVNEIHFAARKTVIMQRVARLLTNLGNLHVSQDVGYVRTANNNKTLTKYG